MGDAFYGFDMLLDDSFVYIRTIDFEEMFFWTSLNQKISNLMSCKKKYAIVCQKYDPLLEAFAIYYFSIPTRFLILPKPHVDIQVKEPFLTPIHSLYDYMQQCHIQKEKKHINLDKHWPLDVFANQKHINNLNNKMTDAQSPQTYLDNFIMDA